MKIAVTTPSGHVGSAVADYLTETGEEVRLLGRRPEKLRKYAERGAKIVRGSQDDKDYVIWMTEGVDALFWVTPPGYGSDDLRSYQNRMGKSASEAIRVNQIPRVVNLSAVGGQYGSGVGPINGLHDVEQLLDQVATNILHLRPGFFFENFLWQLEAMRSEGSIFLPVSGSRRYPMIATRDVGRVAADWLLDDSWTGHWVQELHGPVDMTFEEAATAISEGSQRKITFVQVSPERTRHRMVESGMSENAADLMLEMFNAIETERLRAEEPRSSRTTTPTTLVEFARDVIGPRLREPVPH